METKFQKVIRVVREFFGEMELSDKIFLAMYGIVFTAIGLLFEFEVLAKPFDWKVLIGDSKQYEYYMVAYMALSASNLIMIGMALFYERGMIRQIKALFGDISSYSYSYGGHSKSFTKNSLFGSIVSLVYMLLINIILFNTFIVINGIVLIIVGGIGVYIFISNPSSR